MLLPFSLLAGSISAPLLEVHDNKASVRIDRTNTGVSGFIVRHFNKERSIILANAVVSDYDKENGIALLDLSPYTGLRQNSLPSGKWTPKAGDEAVLGFAYTRAILIAPTDEIYHNITSRIPSLDWAHPDTFAAFLSYRGHPTPLKNDFRDYCTVTSSGLLYIYIQESLFTMDCKSMNLLQIIPADMERHDAKLPFYFRFEKIRAAWWGEGSNELTSYDPYYFHLIAQNNHDSKLLKKYAQKNSIPLKEEQSHWYDGFSELFQGVEIGLENDDEEE